MLMNNNIIMYISKDGNVKVDVNLKNDDIWMSQNELAKLFDTTKNNISIHMKNISCGEQGQTIVQNILEIK